MTQPKNKLLIKVGTQRDGKGMNVVSRIRPDQLVYRMHDEYEEPKDRCEKCGGRVGHSVRRARISEEYVYAIVFKWSSDGPRPYVYFDREDMAEGANVPIDRIFVTKEEAKAACAKRQAELDAIHVGRTVKS